MHTQRGAGVLGLFVGLLLLVNQAQAQVSISFHGISTYHVFVTLYGSTNWPQRLTTYRNVAGVTEVIRTLLETSGNVSTWLALEPQPGEEGVARWQRAGDGRWWVVDAASFNTTEIAGTPNYALADTITIDGGNRTRVVELPWALSVPAGRNWVIRNLTLNPHPDARITVEGRLEVENSVFWIPGSPWGPGPGGIDVKGDGSIGFRGSWVGNAGQGDFGVQAAASVEFTGGELTGLGFSPLNGRVTMDNCKVSTAGNGSIGTGKLAITNCEAWLFGLLSGPGAECRVESSILRVTGYDIHIADLAKLTLKDLVVEARIRATAVADLSIRDCEFYNRLTLTLASSHVVDISNNVWVGPLELAGAAGPGVSVWANDFIGQQGLVVTATGFDLTDANYWGGWTGPTQERWLDPGGTSVSGVTVESMDIWADPIHAADRASSRPEARPFPALWVADWQLGQNVLGRTVLAPRAGRDTLLTFDIRTSATRLDGVTFSLRWDDNPISPEPGFELVRDHGPTPAIAAGADTASARLALSFTIPKGLTGAGPHTCDLIIDATAVSGYATAGRAETYHLSINWFDDRALGRKLTILVVDVINLTAGYEPTNAMGPGARELADYLTQAIPALLPIKPSELCVRVGPTYPFMSWFASASDIWQPWLVGCLLAELDAYRWFTGASRNLVSGGTDGRFDFIVGVVPDDALAGDSGLMWEGDRRVALVRSGAIALGLHELGHCWGLYIEGSEQYDRPNGTDGRGNLIAEAAGASGAILEGLSAFNPESGSSVPVGGLTARIAHFPAGRSRGIIDVMGNGRPYWIVPTSRDDAYGYLQGLLGLAAPDPTPPQPQFRRLRFTARFEKNSTYDPPVFRPVTPIKCQVADNLVDTLTGQKGTGMYFRAYDRAGNIILHQPCKHDLEIKLDNWTTVVWNQTFDVPSTAYSYAVVRQDGSTWKAVFTGTDLGSEPGATLTGPPRGNLRGRNVNLSTSGSRGAKAESDHPLATPTLRQLYYSADEGATWVPIGVDLEGDSLSMPADFLPASESISIKLVAADGFRSSESVLTGYSMSPGAPTVSIASPQAGDAALPGTPWTLAAEATSPDGGSLTAAWNSARDGVLGNGFRLELLALSEGDHVLTCTVSADNGTQAAATVAVRVAADAGPDLRVASEAISIRRRGLAPEVYCPNRPQVGSPCDVTLAVRNPGVACQIRARLYVSAPDGRGENLLATDTLATTPFQAFALAAVYTPLAAGTYEFRASLEALDATDPDPGNNTTTWTFANETPLARAGRALTEIGQPRSLVLDATDPDGNALTYEIVAPPAQGLLAGTAPALTYTPPAGVAGPFPFTYRVSDGLAWSDVATFTLSVIAASVETPLVDLVTLVEPAGAGSVGPFFAATLPIGEDVPIPIVAQPADTYEFAGWWLGGNGTPTLADANAASTTVTAHGGSVVVRATFRKIPTEARLRFLTNGWGYISLTPTGGDVGLDLTVTLGQDSPPVYAIPGPGYEFVNWTCAAHFAVTDNPLVVTAVSEALSISANFSPIPGDMTLTLAADPPADGTVVPSGPVTGIAPEQVVDIEAVPAAGFWFTGWSAAPATAQFGSVTNADTTVRITRSTAVTAHFAPLPVVVAFRASESTLHEADATLSIEVVLGSASLGVVTVNCAVVGGSATAGVDFLLTPGILAFQPGETRRMIALTALGDGVDETTEMGMIALSGPVNATLGTPAGHRFSILDTPGWLSVVFAAAAHGTLRGRPVQAVASGADSSPVEAVGDEGYEFDRWDGSSAANRDNPRIVRNVTAAVVLTAIFRPAPPAVAPDGRFAASVAAAQVAVGRGLWDLTGAYATTLKSDSLVLNLLHGPTGGLTGTATYTIAKDTTVTMPIRGSAKGTRGSITMKGTMKGAAPGQTVSVSLRLNLTVDTANRQLVGHLTGTVKENGTTTPVNEDLTLTIPGPMDGTWTLRLDLDQAGGAVTGTATLVLSNGVDHAFVVRGRTGANSTAVLSLAGDPADPASSAVKIRTTITPLEGGSAKIESFSGRGYGQTVAW